MDLDETLPYEVDEQDSVELAPLFKNPESTPNLEIESDLAYSTTVEAATSVPSDNSVDSECDELDKILGLNSEPIDQSTETVQTSMLLSQPTRAGRVRKRPRHSIVFKISSIYQVFCVYFQFPPKVVSCMRSV